MMDLTVTREVCFRLQDKGRKVVEKALPEKPKPPSSVPRVSRLMALAIRMEEMIRDGEVKSYADIARICFVTTARITQIMNLLHLAPDIQEDLLFLPRSDGGHDAITERTLRPIVSIIDWRKQGKAWENLRAAV